MPEPIYILIVFVLIFISAIESAMFLRGLLSWFTDLDGPLVQFLYVLTEPAIMPMRKLFVKMNWFQGTPIDMAFSATSILLLIISIGLLSLIM